MIRICGPFSGIVLFDVGAQFTGKEEDRKIWEACFPYFVEIVGTERKDVEIHVCDDMAVAHGYSRLTGMDSTSDMAHSWLRTTVCYKKVANQWKVFYEQVSLPVDCEKEKPIYILDSDSESLFQNARIAISCKLIPGCPECNGVLIMVDDPLHGIRDVSLATRNQWTMEVWRQFIHMMLHCNKKQTHDTTCFA